jgi:hypothetical protein
LSNEASQQQPVFIVTYPAKSSISVPVGVSSDDFIKKEIETYLLSYLTPEDNKFINQQDIVFQMLTREFTCDIGKVRFNWLFYFL